MKESGHRYLLLQCATNRLRRNNVQKRGLHFAFASAEYVSKNRTHQQCALGIEVDIRCGKNAYILLKQNGAMREIVRELDENLPVDPVPRWLVPLKSAKSFFGMAEGDGCNSALFAYGGTLFGCGFTRGETRKTIRLINRYLFKMPLPHADRSMAELIKSNAFFIQVNLSIIDIGIFYSSDCSPASYFPLAVTS